MEPAGVSDEEFLKVGAKCVDTMEEIYEKCDFIGKFKDMTDADMKMPFKKGQIIMTAFHMAEGTAKPEQVKILADAGVTCISIETFSLSRRFPRNDPSHGRDCRPYGSSAGWPVSAASVRRQRCLHRSRYRRKKSSRLHSRRRSCRYVRSTDC